MRSYFAVLIALAASTLAYQVTYPNAAQDWTTSGSNTVQWQRVSTDPLNFTIVLTNTNRSVMAQNNQILDALVDGTSGSTSVNAPSGGWPIGGSFRVNLVQDATHLDAILAQSNEFNIVQGTSSSSTASTATGAISSASNSPTTLSVPAASTAGSSNGGSLNPTTSDTSTTPTASSGALPAAGIQTGFLGLVALVGAVFIA